MRVLHVYSGNLYGGIETFLHTLARSRSLCPGMEPEFALCFEGRLSSELLASGVPVHLLGPVRASRPLSVLRARRRIRELLKQTRYDAVVCHAFWSHAIFARPIRESGAKLFFYLHDFASGKSWMERWARVTPPDQVICNSRATQATLPKLFPPARSQVLLYPVSPKKLPAPRQELRKGIRTALGTPPDETVIIQVSRLEEWKGQTLLIDALAQLKNKPGWKAWIVGGPQRKKESEYLDRLQELVREHGLENRVRFLGQRSDVYDLLAAADIFCQPNTSPEPFGISMVEALFAGLPVVSTKMGGALEIVDADSGILAAPNPGAVARALAKLMGDSALLAKMAEAAPKRAREICEVESCLGILKRFLEGS